MRNDGRLLVEVSKVQTFAAKLLHVQIVGLCANQLPCCLTLGVGCFDVVRHSTPGFDHLLRMVHDEMRHLLGDGVSLSFVRIQNIGVRPAIHRSTQQPSQVGGIGNAGIHAVACVGYPKMRCIAG